MFPYRQYNMVVPTSVYVVPIDNIPSLVVPTVWYGMLYHGCSHSMVCFYRDNIYMVVPVVPIVPHWYVSIGSIYTWLFQQ